MPRFVENIAPVKIEKSDFERIAEAVCAILREGQDIRYDWRS